MKKILTILTILLIGFTSYSQDVSGSRIIGRQAFYFVDRWLTGTYNDTILLNGVTDKIVTPNAIYDFVVGRIASSTFPNLTGDVTTLGTVATLAPVNLNVGLFGSSTSIPSFTVNEKGLITQASSSVVIAPAGTLTGTDLATNVITSSLTSVGTIVTGVWNGTAISTEFGGSLIAYQNMSLYTPSINGINQTGRQGVDWGANIFLGDSAGVGASNVSWSNFLGERAGYYADSAQSSNFFGSAAGLGATFAYQSNFLGEGAGRNAINAYSSNFLGGSTGYNATNAFWSNFFGPAAGFGATNADNSNFFGQAAGQTATNADHSNFIGQDAGQEATNANHSNFIGSNAGNFADDAYESNFLGTFSGFSADSASNSIFIGNHSGHEDGVFYPNKTHNGINDYSILLGKYTRTNGYRNSIILGGSINTSYITNTNDNQFMLAPNIINLRWRGIDYVLPSSQAVGVLTNDGSGGLTWSAGGGGGTVTTVSVVTANGISGSVATATTTPAITLTLGAITPTTVNGNTITTGTGVLTLGAGKTLTASNTITFTATDGSTLAIGTGGTLGTNAYTSTAYQPLDADLTIVAAIGTALQQIRVNAGATALEYFTPAAGGVAWGAITGTLSDQTDLQTALNLKANLASPTFTGTVTIPTPFTLGAVSVLPTGTELNFVDGVTSAIQTQLDGKQPLDADLTIVASIGTALQQIRVNAGGTALEYFTASGGGGVTDFIFTDGGGFDGTVATSTSTPTLSIIPSFTGWAYSNGSALAAGSFTSPLINTTGTLSLVGLSGLGTANQILGMNSGATSYEYKTLATGTSGTNFTIDHTANTVTFNIPTASSTATGKATSNQVIGTIGVSLDGQGGVISTGSKGFITIPYDMTLTHWYVVCNVSGSIQLDIKRSGTTIIGGGNKPTLSSAISGNAAISGWTSVAVTAGDILEWNVDSGTTVTSCSCTVKGYK